MRILMVLLMVASTALHAGGDKKIKEMMLDEMVIYKIPVAGDGGTTTLMFPTAIESIKASRITTGVEAEKSVGAAFLMSFQPGSYYLTLRALNPKATDVMTVIIGRKAYVFELVASREPIYTAVFYHDDPQGGGRRGRGRSLSPGRLISLLDKAKAYQLFAEHHPDALSQVSHAPQRRTMYYRDFRVHLTDVWRFDKEDTLVFKVLFENITDQPVRYKAGEFAVRVGDRIYTQSISDASGIIPPKAEAVPAYFAITGTPAGGRNNLSPENDWTVLVPREDTGLQERHAVRSVSGDQDEEPAGDSPEKPSTPPAPPVRTDNSKVLEDPQGTSARPLFRNGAFKAKPVPSPPVPEKASEKAVPSPVMSPDLPAHGVPQDGGGASSAPEGSAEMPPPETSTNAPAAGVPALEPANGGRP